MMMIMANTEKNGLNEEAKEPVEDTGSNKAVTSTKLVFVDYTDLQTRLQLLPKDDDECLGAVISSYSPLSSDTSNADHLQNTIAEKESTPIKENEAKGDNDLRNGMGIEIDVLEEQGNTKDGGKSPSLQLSIEKLNEHKGPSSQVSVEAEKFEEKKDDSQATMSTLKSDDALNIPSQKGKESSIKENGEKIDGFIKENLTGFVLKDIEGIDYDGDWGNCEFSFILDSCRNAPTPIVLGFEASDTDPQLENFHSDNPINSASSKSTQEQQPMMSHRFSRWSSKMRQTTSLLASSTASRVAEVAAKAKESAVEAASKAKDSAVEAIVIQANQNNNSGVIQKSSKLEEEPEEEVENILCGIFMQSVEGGLVEIDKPMSPFSSFSQQEQQPHQQNEITITNTTLLMCRHSKELPLATNYTCQWYRSKPYTQKWYLIRNASHPTFQPSVTEIGYRLKCVISFDSTEIASCQLGGVENHRMVVCAEKSIFNAARQSLSGSGSNFGNMMGWGRTEGRMFKLKIELSRTTTASMPTTIATGKNNGGNASMACKLSIFQVSGSTAEPLHDHETEPILNPSVYSSHLGPKAFELRINTPSENSMLAALSVDGNRLQLSAPNRISRESVLLSLGVAKYRGKPSALTTSTILFHDDELDDVEAEEEGKDYRKNLDSETTDQTEDDEVTTESPSSSSSESDSEMSSLESCDDDELVRRDEEILSLGGSIGRKNSSRGNSSSEKCFNQIDVLETNLKNMAKTLSSKDKEVMDLQRTIRSLEGKLLRAQNEASESIKRQRKVEDENSVCSTKLKQAEMLIETQSLNFTKMKTSLSEKILQLENTVNCNNDKFLEHEKQEKSLQNEIAVLSAAVEAREGKLQKMSSLKDTVNELTKEVEEKKKMHEEMVNMSVTINDQQRYLETKDDIISSYQKKLADANESIESLKGCLEISETRCTSMKEKLVNVQVQNQKLKTERNKFKQKSDSLSKEMSRLSRNGVLHIEEIERIIDNQEAMQSELSILKASKKKAVQEMEDYRSDYIKLVRAQDLAGGVDFKIAKTLEQRVELEKVVEDLTEYVQAKEMQIETMRAVNKNLMEELTTLKDFRSKK